LTGAERLDRALQALWEGLCTSDVPPELPDLPTGQEAAARELDRRLRQLWRPDDVATAPTATNLPPELRDGELCAGPEVRLHTAGVSAKDDAAVAKGDRGVSEKP
jgi:hypothetical protein